MDHDFSGWLGPYLACARVERGWFVEMVRLGGYPARAFLLDDDRKMDPGMEFLPERIHLSCPLVLSLAGPGLRKTV